MTSPEWEAANEDDSDRFPQTSHASASESTESHERGSRVVPDPARVARYAEAIRSCVIADPEQLRDLTEAVVAVADAEQAELRAEVERLRHASKQNAIQASRADRRADREEARAEAAEAKVARVEALLALRESNNIRDEEGFVVVRADDVRAMIHPGPDHSCESNGEGTCRHCGADEPPPWPTRAVLADAPAEQRDDDLCPGCRSGDCLGFGCQSMTGRKGAEGDGRG